VRRLTAPGGRPGGEERALQFVDHAVERLELVGARVDAEPCGLGDGVGTAADVEGGERG